MKKYLLTSWPIDNKFCRLIDRRQVDMLPSKLHSLTLIFQRKLFHLWKWPVYGHTSGKWKEQRAPHWEGFESVTSWFSGMCSTAVLGYSNCSKFDKNCFLLHHNEGQIRNEQMDNEQLFQCRHQTLIQSKLEMPRLDFWNVSFYL